MKMVQRPRVTCAAALAALMAVVPAASAGDSHRHSAPPAEDAGTKAKATVADLNLVAQDGRRINLRREAIGGRIAVVDFVYTSCTTVCPLASSVMAQVQDRLDGRAVLVTLTVDPATDTPERLRRYAARFDARPGWLWLTGAKGDVDRALKAFGVYTPDWRNHPLVILVGDAERGIWSRYYGVPDPDRIVAKVEELVQARAAPPPATTMGALR